MKKIFFMAVVVFCFSQKGLAQQTHHVTVKINQPANCIVSIDEPIENSIPVYPNPASTSLTIDLPETPASISLVTLLGKTILQQNCNHSVLDLDVKDIPKGIYILLIQYGTTSKPVKIIIE